MDSDLLARIEDSNNYIDKLTNEYTHLHKSAKATRAYDKYLIDIEIENRDKMTRVYRDGLIEEMKRDSE